MFRITGKKRALLGIVASLAIAAAAFAYWTTTGGGAGTATTQDENDIDDLTLSQTALATELFPGDSPQTITVTVTNPSSNDASIRVASVTASKLSVTGAPVTCDVSDYTLTDDTMGPAQEIVAGGTANFSGAKVSFNNKPAENQDDCKGATLNLSYTVNGS